MAETRKLAAILAADVSVSAGSPAPTRIARWRASERCAATWSTRPSRCITAASSSAPATARWSSFAASSMPCAARRGAERDGRAQRRRAGGSPHRVPHRHSCGRRRRGKRRRSDGRRRQHRRAAGGHRMPGAICLPRMPTGRWARLDLVVSDLGQPSSRTSSSRCGCIRCRSGAARARPTSRPPARRKRPCRGSCFPTSPRSPCCRSRT